MADKLSDLNAAWLAGGQFASDALSVYFGGLATRSQLKIKAEQDRINEMLAESAFARNMESLFAAQQDLKDKASQEAIAAQRKFKQKEAEIRVAQAERGMMGQSAADIQSDIVRVNEAFKQIQLSNLAKAERNAMLQRQSLIDARTEQMLGTAVKSYSLDPTFMGIAALPAAGIDAMLTYFDYRDEISNPDPLIDRSED